MATLECARWLFCSDVRAAFETAGGCALALGSEEAMGRFSSRLFVIGFRAALSSAVLLPVGNTGCGRSSAVASANTANASAHPSRVASVSLSSSPEFAQAARLFRSKDYAGALAALNRIMTRSVSQPDRAFLFRQRDICLRAVGGPYGSSDVRQADAAVRRVDGASAANADCGPRALRIVLERRGRRDEAVVRDGGTHWGLSGWPAGRGLSGPLGHGTRRFGPAGTCAGGLGAAMGSTPILEFYQPSSSLRSSSSGLASP